MNPSKYKQARARVHSHMRTHKQHTYLHTPNQSPNHESKQKQTHARVHTYMHTHTHMHTQKYSHTYLLECEVSVVMHLQQVCLLLQLNYLSLLTYVEGLLPKESCFQVIT